MSAAAPPPSPDHIEFLKTLKNECQQMKKRIAVEAKQKVKFLVLNAVQVKKLKLLSGMIKEFEDAIKSVKEADKEKEGKDLQAQLTQMDKIVERMKESVKP